MAQISLNWGVQQQHSWRSSINVLKNLTLRGTGLDKNHQVEEHLQCLIDCVNRLHKENKDIKILYEEEAIRNSSVTRKYESIKTKLDIDIEDAKRNTKANNGVKIRSLQRRKWEQENEADMLLKTEMSIEASNARFLPLVEKMRMKKSELIELINWSLGKKSRAVVNVNATRAMALAAQQAAIACYDQMKSNQLQHEAEMLKYNEDIDKLAEEARIWSEKVKDFDERVTEQRETVEKIHADTKESQFRNKTMQRSLTEQSVKLATLKSRTVRFFNKNERFTKTKEMEERAIKQTNDKITWTRDDLQRKINLLTATNEAQFREKKILSEEQAKLSEIKNKMVEKRDEQRDKLTTQRSELALLQGEIETKTNQVTEAVGEVASLRMMRMMMKEKLVYLADARHSMDRYYGAKFKVLREQYKKERAARLAVKEELKKAEELLQKVFNDVLGFKVNTLNKEFEAREMWEILDEKEAELIGEIMNLKKKEKEYINQIAISADACAIRSDEIKYDMELMESQIKNLESAVCELKRKEEVREQNCKELGAKCAIETKNRNRLVKNYRSLLQKHKVVLKEVQHARTKLQTMQSCRQETISILENERTGTVSKIRNNADNLEQQSVDICSLMSQIEVLKKATEILRNDCSDYEGKISGLRDELQTGNESLFNLERLHSHLRETWQDSLMKISNLNEKEIRRNEKHMREMNLLKSHFSDRVFRINRAGNDMDESVTNFSEKLPQDLSEDMFSSLKLNRKPKRRHTYG